MGDDFIIGESYCQLLQTDDWPMYKRAAKINPVDPNAIVIIFDDKQTVLIIEIHWFDIHILNLFKIFIVQGEEQ